MKKVCIIEDMAFTRLSLEKLLSALEFTQIESYASAEDALKSTNLLEEKLYLLDVNLSGIFTGIDFARELRKQTKAPIVFLTAMGDTKTLSNILQIEPDGYILKPYNLSLIHI